MISSLPVLSLILMIADLFPNSESTVRCTVYSLNNSMRFCFLTVCKKFSGQILLSCIQFPSFLKANYEKSIIRIVAPLTASWLASSVGKGFALYAGGPGFKSREELFFFFVIIFYMVKKCIISLKCQVVFNFTCFSICLLLFYDQANALEKPGLTFRSSIWKITADEVFQKWKYCSTSKWSHFKTIRCFQAGYATSDRKFCFPSNCL